MGGARVGVGVHVVAGVEDRDYLGERAVAIGVAGDAGEQVG
jgi:hypothetical protein